MNHIRIAGNRGAKMILKCEIARRPRLTLLFAVLLTALLGRDSLGQKRLTADRLFAPAHLVQVEIKISQGDWEKLCSQSRTFGKSLGKTPAKRPFTYFKGHVTIDGVVIDDVLIRKKGFLGSLDETRPSLKIKFPQTVRENLLEGFDRLTLNNNKQDPSQCSQYLSYRMFNATGTAASRCNLAKVTVNGTNLGIYSNVESIKPPFLTRRFGDASGDLHEGTVADLFPDTLRKFEAKTASSKSNHLSKIAKLLVADELDLPALEKLLDVDAFLRFWAGECLIGFWDGYSNNQNNYFVYRRPSNSKLYFIPWGADSSFTNVVPLPPFKITNKTAHSNGFLAYRLYQDERVRARYQKTLSTMLAKHWDEEELTAEVDRVAALVKDHLHATQQGFAADHVRLKRFIGARRAVLEKELKRWPVKLAAKPRRPVYFKEIGKATVKFATKWSARSVLQPHTVGEVEINLQIDGKPVKFRKIGASAEPSKFPAPGQEKPPALVIAGRRASDGKLLIFGTGLTPTEFKPSARPKPLQGVMIEGAFGFLNPAGFKFLAGTVQFDEAAMKPGASVRGKAEFSIMKVIGGDAR